MTKKGRGRSLFLIAPFDKRAFSGRDQCLTGGRESYRIFVVLSRCGSMVEQRIRNAQVSGSSPLAGSI